MNQFFYIIFTLSSLLIVRTLCGEVPLQNLCPSPEGGKIVSFQVTDCHGLPCTFVRDKTYKIDLIFQMGRNVSQARIQCRISSVVWTKPQTIPDFDACNGLSDGAKCPLIAGNNYGYSHSVKIPAVPPSVYTVSCEFVDDQKMNQICVSGDARIVLW